MRNLKKLLAVIVTVCLLATFAIPAFADEADSKICADLGMILGSGGGVTAEYLASQPTRLQGAIMFLRLKALEDEAKAFIVTGENFSDLDGLNETNKAILGYLKANPQLGFAGIGDNKFAPLQLMTAKEYYKVLLVALGYEEGTDFTWANVLQFAASKGLVKLLDNDNFTVSDLCTATVEALKATVKGGTDTLISVLVENGIIAADKAKASGLYSGVPKALEIVSATADNWKAAKFVFSKELDADTIKTDNFTGVDLKTVKLLDDGKTVVVVLKDAVTEQSTKKDITVKNVKAKDGATIAETKKSVEFVDTTIPVIGGAVAKNAKAIIITASEPLNAEHEYYTFEKIKIDDVEVAVESSTVDYKTNNLTLNLVSALDKGSHTIEIGGLKDYAGYTAATVTNNIDVPEDTTAPEIVSAKMNSTTEIEVTFNEDIEVAGTFKVNGESADATQKADDRTKFTLTKFGDPLDIGATVEVKVRYKDQEDVVGNKVESWKTFTFKVEDDTTLPTVTATVGDKNEIKLTFSKNMDKTKGTVRFYDKDDKQIGSDIALDSADVTWDGLTVAKIANDAGGAGLDDTDEKEIKIKISDCKDATVRANGLPETTITLKVKDTKQPTVVAKYNFKVDDDDDKETITLYFSEAMDEATLKNLSNYVITSPAGAVYANGKALAEIDGVSIKEVSSDKKSVTIKGKKIGEAAADGLAFRVYAIKDLAGNMMVTNNSVAALTAADVFALDDAAVATAENKIKLTFTMDVKSVSTSAFVVRDADDNDKVIASVASVAIDSDNAKKVTLTLSKKIGVTDTDDDNDIELWINNKSGVKDVFGRELVDSNGVYGQLADEIKPYAEADKTNDADEIKITFKEKVDIEEEFKYELVIKKGSDLLVFGTDYTIEELGDPVDWNQLAGLTEIIIKGAGITGGTEYKVSIISRGAVEDADGNALAEMAETKVTPKR